MKKLHVFKEGQLVSAAEWNAVAGEVNRIWAMQADANFELTKAEPWRIRFLGDATSDTIKYPNAPMVQIYVYRASAPADWQVDLPPSAIFITGPFDVVGRTDANHIVKITKKSRTNRNLSRVDRDWCAAFGFLSTSADTFVPYDTPVYETIVPYAEAGAVNIYYTQRMSKCPATGDLLITEGNRETDRDGNHGKFFAVDWETGVRQFSPYANIEALVPGIVDCPVTGVASYGQTIALSTSVLSGTASGLTLYDTSGNPVFSTLDSSYVIKDSTSAIYRWIVASQNAYFFNSLLAGGLGGGSTPGTHKVEAGVVDGYAPFDATFYANGAVYEDPPGFQQLVTPGYTVYYPPRINSGEDGMHLQSKGVPAASLDDGWKHESCLSQFTSFTVAGVTTVLTEPELPDISTYPLLIPFDYIDAVSGIVFGYPASPSDTEGSFFVRTYNGSAYVLTEIDGFNGPVYDVKYFRTKDDNVTRQFIVVGEFTEYQGQPALYLMFCDQNGNRLADLEWP